jgi:glycosyltransferase involved in cell wall biosynthesis
VSATARYLADRGVRVAVYTSGASQSNIGTEIPLISFGPEVGVRCIPMLLKFARANRQAEVTIQWTATDSGNGIFATALVLSLGLLRLCGCRTHLFIHQLWTPWGRIWQWPWSAWTRLLTVSAGLVATRISVPVQSWAWMLKRLFFFKRSRIGWVPVGATVLPTHRPLKANERHRNPWVLLFNPLATTKNPYLVEAAWSRLAQKAPQTQCAVIGKVPAREDSRLKYLMQHPDCRFLGLVRTKQVSEWMSRSIALLAPFDEGVSACRTSVISALAHGLPVVTTHGPQTESLWHHTEGVILVDPNPGDLADALLRLHLDESYWERASQQARAFFKKHFEWDHVLDRMFPALTALKSKPRPLVSQKNR